MRYYRPADKDHVSDKCYRYGRVFCHLRTKRIGSRTAKTSKIDCFQSDSVQQDLNLFISVCVSETDFV